MRNTEKLAMYESIMRKVSREVKSALNEGVSYRRSYRGINESTEDMYNRVLSGSVARLVFKREAMRRNGSLNESRRYGFGRRLRMDESFATTYRRALNESLRNARSRRNVRRALSESRMGFRHSRPLALGMRRY